MIDKIIQSLINKESESKQINEWAKESASNLEILQQLKNLDIDSDKLLHYKPFDEKAAWKKVDPQASSKAKNIKWLIGIAATLLIAIATTFLFNDFFAKGTDSNYELVTTTDKPKILTLKDNTMVKLDADSKLTIKQDRYVDLQGRGFFHVTKNDKDRPFTITLNGGKVVVLGTKFSVLRTDDNFEVNVIEGHVRVEFEGRSIDLYQEDHLKLLDKKILVNKEKRANDMAWERSKLIFEDSNIRSVLADVSSYFKINFRLDKALPNLEKCLLTTTMENPTLEQVIDELEAIFKAKIVKIKGGYLITEIQC